MSDVRHAMFVAVMACLVWAPMAPGQTGTIVVCQDCSDFSEWETTGDLEEAFNRALSGDFDTVLVAPGTYQARIEIFPGDTHGVEVVGMGFLADEAGADPLHIVMTARASSDAVVKIKSPNAPFTFRGLTIQGGKYGVELQTSASEGS
ncbi:MAG TPA: hypothetical protein ENN80_07690, partial [Candidatus Hydrogenedentes bacterium]|nr:hypothetical protein [Candidatus Hydrogenedentota bacterium]